MVVPTSLDRVGVDPYPKFSMKPTKLLELMLFSSEPESVDYGFQKDADTGMYLKNRKTADKEEIDAQFGFISMRPPLGYYNEDTYIDWVKGNMDKLYSATLQSKYYTSTNPAVTVAEEEDPDFNVEHIYKIVTASTTYKFYKNTVANWPVNKNVTITKKSTTTSTSGETSSGY